MIENIETKQSQNTLNTDIWLKGLSLLYQSGLKFGSMDVTKS